MSNLILAEQRDGKPRKGAFELVAAARQLGGEVAALVTGEGAAAAAEALAAYCDSVHHAAEVPAGNQAATVTALQAAAAETGASRVLLSANRTGQAVAPRLAVRLDAAFLEDVGSLAVDGQKVRATRLSYLSRVTETVETDAPRVVISIKPNTWDPAAESGSTGTVSALAVTARPQDGRAAASDRQQAAGGQVSLGEATTVVAGGRGVGSAEAFAQLVEPLAAAFGAGIGSTRAVVDAGWRPFAEQVGQTGKTVSPALYIALGISGAVQHLSGMNRSKVIVTINRDADAPLFKISDYGIVGDVNQIVPELVKAVREHKDAG